ncbi:hypothetical protein T12_13170 [Trichinella patagoniensis]|uniref:Uncharacterized protein n=1 Tax=Trichinella patagoniensis TaxID=990121 RepID=A0A0V0ZQT6_9BILA|nr:hypothetical protein T12_13170 [Trichinella patagoniensis]
MEKIVKYYVELNTGKNNFLQLLEQNVVLFAQFTEDVISHWSFIQHENESLSKLNKQYEQEAEKQRTKVKELKAELIEARSQLAALVASKQALASEKQILAS